MATPHAVPGEIVDLSNSSGQPTRALFRTGLVELVRLGLPAGKTIPSHQAPGELIVHCLSGRVEFTTMGRTVTLEPGQLLHLLAAEPHAVHAVDDSQLLLTIVGPGRTTPHVPASE